MNNSGKDAQTALDHTDRKILSALAANARMSARAIARETGVSVTAVLDRIQQLERNRTVLGYRVEVDPQSVGYGVTAMVGLRIDGTVDVPALQDDLFAIEEVQVLHWITAPYHLLVTVYAKSADRIQHILLERIRRIPGVVGMECMLSLKQVRRPGGQFAFVWMAPDRDGDQG